MVTEYIFYHTSNILRLIQPNEIFLSNTIDVVCQLFDNLIFNILQTNQTFDSFINLYHTEFFVLWSKNIMMGDILRLGATPHSAPTRYASSSSGQCPVVSRRTKLNKYMYV